jgi:hypothetical protein
LAEWPERCASIPKITQVQIPVVIALTFRSDVLLTATVSAHWVCLYYPGNTLCSQRLEPPVRAG